MKSHLTLNFEPCHHCYKNLLDSNVIFVRLPDDLAVWSVVGAEFCFAVTSFSALYWKNKSKVKAFVLERRYQ